MRPALAGITLLVSVLLPAFARAAPPLSADQAVAAALPRSPALAEAEAALARAEGAQKAACGVQHDPQLQAAAAVVGEAWSVSVLQPVSLSGAGRAACRAAEHGRAAAASQRARAELEVAAAARQAWVDAVAADGTAALAARSLAVAEQITEAAAARAEAGEASLLDLRLARLQREQARTAWMQARVVAGELRSQLAAQTGLDADSIALPDDPLPGAPPLGAPGSAERRDVGAARAQVEAAQAAVQRERARTLPPVSIGAFVEEEGPELRAGPRVSLTLPLWRANVDNRAAADAALAAAVASAAATSRQAGAQQASARRVSQDLEQALTAQPENIPEEARRGLESAALGYDRGELDLLSTSLMQAQILAGHQAWLEGRRVVASARITGLLAEEDPRLLGPR